MTIAEMEEKIIALEHELVTLRMMALEAMQMALSEPHALDIKEKLYGFYLQGHGFNSRAAEYLKKRLSEDLST